MSPTGIVPSPTFLTATPSRNGGLPYSGISKLSDDGQMIIHHLTEHMLLAAVLHRGNMELKTRTVTPEANRPPITSALFQRIFRTRRERAQVLQRSNRDCYPQMQQNRKNSSTRNYKKNKEFFGGQGGN